MPAIPLAPLPDDIAANVEQLGAKQLNLYRCLAHAPELLRAWINFAWALRGHETTERRLRELMILRTATLHHSPYEWHQHRRMAREAGATDYEVAELEMWRTSEAFSDADRAALAFTDAIVAGDVPPAVIEELMRHFDNGQRVELTVTAAFYSMVPRVLDALGVPIEEREPPPGGVRPRRPQTAARPTASLRLLGPRLPGGGVVLAGHGSLCSMSCTTAPVMIPTTSCIERLLRVHDRHALAEPVDVDAVGDLEHVRHVVADQDHRQPVVADALDELEHLPGLLDAERGRRLVHDHELARPRRGARHRDALALAARERLHRLAHGADADLQVFICLSASSRMPLWSSMRKTLPSGPSRRFSRPRNRLVAMSSAGATARSW